MTGIVFPRPGRRPPNAAVGGPLDAGVRSGAAECVPITGFCRVAAMAPGAGEPEGIVRLGLLVGVEETSMPLTARELDLVISMLQRVRERLP